MPGAERVLIWEGSFNVRDLGGIPTIGGGETRWASFVRADSLEGLSAAGWAALVSHGIRTVVDLRNPEEIGPDRAPRPDALVTLNVPLDDVGDIDFWATCHSEELDGSPLYYAPFLERKPERCAMVMRALANAEPGPVVFHCGLGRDRAGIVSVLLLALAGAAPDDIAADYDLSLACLAERIRREEGEARQTYTERILARRNTTTRALIAELLGGVDIQDYLREAGVEDAELEALRARLVGAP
jgi:protein-tyrosine phosphatase